MTFQDREEAIFGMDRLLVPRERMTDRLNYLRDYKNRQYGEHWEFREDNNLHSLRDRPFLAWLVDEGMETLKETHLRPEEPVAADNQWGGIRVQGGTPNPVAQTG